MIRTITIATTILLTAGVAARAEPLALASDGAARLVLVAGGCGPAFHRNPFGACVPNRPYYVVGGPAVVVAPPVRLPPPCPRFYHRDPDPARPICYPNF